MTIDHFPAFATLVAEGFQFITAHDDTFVADIAGDTLYELYLASFPEGTNPIFKERTEHDCSLCKQFIRRAANVVTVDEDGKLMTVWDEAAAKDLGPYTEVATILANTVKSAPIVNLFRVSEGAFGTPHSRAQNSEGDVVKWSHLHTGKIPKSLRSTSPDEIRGKYRTTVQVFERGLTELKVEAIDTVLSLIEANSLYRGEEHKAAVIAFKKAKAAFDKGGNPNAFIWSQAKGKASRFRNSVIGTLVQDLSEGKDLEHAVKGFETKVAPSNYKRTSALITPAMVKSAMATIESLGLEPALDRRFARIDDISVNDVLWVDSTVEPLMKGGLGAMLMSEAKKDTSLDEKKAEDISVDEFLSRVVPKAKGMEVLFKGEHLGNLMSLTAPVHEKPQQLFRWNNDFAWSYNGNIADSSIKERVKKAGGNVTNALLRTSLSWFNYDDLDIHLYEPDGTHIQYKSKKGRHGELDVDMNISPESSREAVENVSFKTLVDGEYKVVVNNFTHRETLDVGFVVEVENAGKLSYFNYAKEIRHKQDIHVVTLHVKDDVVIKFERGDKNITTTAVSKEKWGLKTEQYVKVNALTLSPNHWGDASEGNRHTFFVLEGALNDEPCRGIYNEFLHPRLVEHRKVFELIGDKTKCQPTEGQLSGLGFSSTKKDSVLVKVTQGQNTRLFNVKIGGTTSHKDKDKK